MGAVVAFPAERARGHRIVGQVSTGPLPHNVCRLNDRRSDQRVAELSAISAERLLMSAVFFALTTDQKKAARDFLGLFDPTRAHEATELVEKLMRRIRQLS